MEGIKFGNPLSNTQTLKCFISIVISLMPMSIAMQHSHEIGINPTSTFTNSSSHLFRKASRPFINSNLLKQPHYMSTQSHLKHTITTTLLCHAIHMDNSLYWSFMSRKKRGQLTTRITLWPPSYPSTPAFNFFKHNLLTWQSKTKYWMCFKYGSLMETKTHAISCI